MNDCHWLVLWGEGEPAPHGEVCSCDIGYAHTEDGHLVESGQL